MLAPSISVEQCSCGMTREPRFGFMVARLPQLLCTRVTRLWKLFLRFEHYAWVRDYLGWSMALGHTLCRTNRVVSGRAFMQRCQKWFTFRSWAGWRIAEC